MQVSVRMPRLGESEPRGTVTRWLKKKGDQVEADEPLLEVSTDKVDTEIPSPASGVLTAICIRENETVHVGAELAVIEDPRRDGTVAAGQQEHRQVSDTDGPTRPSPATVPSPPAPQQAQPDAHPPWSSWAVVAMAVIFTGDAAFGENRPTWERATKGVLAAAIFLGEIVELRKRRRHRP